MKIIVLLQALYFLATGLWPILHISSFMAVTGPKTDIWLVKVIGALVLCLGTVFFYAGYRQKISSETILLGISTCFAFSAVEIFYVMNGDISAVYLLDALFEGGFLACWIFYALHFSKANPTAE
jgi:hypothetical protein